MEQLYQLFYQTKLIYMKSAFIMVEYKRKEAMLMFREMRRNNQQMSKERCIEVLNKNTSGTLALLGDEDYPYALPMSYVFYDNKIYFHSAKTGHKIDAIKKHSKASFCVIDQDEVHELTTYFRSVIAFGKVQLLKGQEKMDAIIRLGLKYHPHMDEVKDEIKKFQNAFEIIELDIEHMTGKEAKELL